MRRTSGLGSADCRKAAGFPHSLGCEPRLTGEHENNRTTALAPFSLWGRGNRRGRSITLAAKAVRSEPGLRRPTRASQSRGCDADLHSGLASFARFPGAEDNPFVADKVSRDHNFLIY